MLAALPAHMRLAVALMKFTGLDRQDALSLPRSAIAGGKLDVRRGKTGPAVWLPLPAQLEAELRAARSHDAVTVCANSQGRPWTVSGFRASWRTVRLRLEEAEAVAPGLTPEGPAPHRRDHSCRSRIR